MIRKTKRIILLLTCALSCAGAVLADTYEKVTSAAQLIPGASYLLVYENGASSYVNGTIVSNQYLGQVAVSISEGTFECPVGAVPLTLGGTTNAWTFDLGQIGAQEHNYLYIYTDTYKYLGVSTKIVGVSSTKWSIDLEGGTTITNTVETSFKIKYVSNTFKVRSGTGSNVYPIALYKKIEQLTSLAPDKDVNLSPTYWATFSNLTGATFFSSSEATVYKVVANKTIVSLTALTEQSISDVTGYVVPAGTGVILSTPNNVVSFSTTSVTSANASDFFADNLLCAATGESISAVTNHFYYKLAYAQPVQGQRDTTSLGFYYGAAGGGSYAPGLGKAYLDWDGSTGTPAPSRLVLGELEETQTPTTVSQFPSVSTAGKVFKNGQWLLLRNGEVFDVTGRKLLNR